MSETAPPLVSGSVDSTLAHDSWISLSTASPGYWKDTVAIVEKSGNMSRIRHVYGLLLQQYPDNASVQLSYIRHFVDNPALFEEGERLFMMFLSTSASVDLWICYLDHVRRTNWEASNWDTIRVAYESALDRVGHDPTSGRIWVDYIEFLEGARTDVLWSAEHKIDALRNVYYRAVAIPVDGLWDIWRRFVAFESQIDKNAAGDVISRLSPAHMKASTVLGELQFRLGSLDDIHCRPGPGVRLSLPDMPTFSSEDRLFIGRWKGYLSWEESDPLQFGDRARPQLISRIRTAYRKAVVRMRFYPEICFLLTYAYAEEVETAECVAYSRNFADVHRVYARLFDAVRLQLEAPTEVSSFEAAESRQVNLLEPKKLYSNAWINYLSFIRRAEGQQACRAAFKKVCHDDFVGWEVFERVAMMEYHCNQDSVDGQTIASRIFHMGMRRFSKDVVYVLKHLNFLLGINDENNALALFEGVIDSFTPQEAKPIWSRWYQFRSQYDALDAVLVLERRMAYVYPDDGSMRHFGFRHMYNSFDAIAEHDLGFSKRSRLQKSSSFQ
ncbi:hypothetical protein C8R43DRAFT_942380 [Mycena crocata]|nr:hypothetical protein C8R43DRAFT_942380 [Mycena crocata]